MQFDPQQFLITMFIVLWALGIHEYSHAKFADLAGDPTPRMMGRVTLNPFKHLDPIGSILIVLSSLSGIGFGWGKPVLVRPDKMRNPRWDHFVSVLAGPLSNFMQAIFFALLLRAAMMGGAVTRMEISDVLLRDSHHALATLLIMGVLINVSLCLFNLIPLGPLDGHWLVGAFLPEPTRSKWYTFNRGIGGLLFLILVFIPSGSQFDLLGRFFYPLVIRVFAFLIGAG